MSGRCHHCRQPYRVDDGVCDSCLDIFIEINERNRHLFHKLISAGVSRKLANRIMIERGEGRPS